MVHELINGTYRETNLKNESAEYLARREVLRLAEIQLMEQQERVAELRRQLPLGEAMRDYEFLEVSGDLDDVPEQFRTITLSDLFTVPEWPLVIYHMMYGKKQNTPCPMCTMWVDGYNGVAPHLNQNINFAIVAAAEPVLLREHARSRRWNNLRLMSAGSNTFKLDLGSEDADGSQDSTISVFTKERNGDVRHFYTAHPRMGPNIKERGIDLLTPVWNLLDLTPHGRGNWYPSLAY